MYQLFSIDTFMVSYYIYGRHTRLWNLNLSAIVKGVGLKWSFNSFFKSDHLMSLGTLGSAKFRAIQYVTAPTLARNVGTTSVSSTLFAMQ